MKRLKELLEKRGAKAKEARTIIDKANTENRSITADEGAKIDALQKEVEAIDAGIAIESRQAAIESQRAPQLSDGERRDMSRFDIGVMLRSMKSSLGGAPNQLFARSRSMAVFTWSPIFCPVYTRFSRAMSCGICRSSAVRS
jgi:hypothetical protein